MSRPAGPVLRLVVADDQASVREGLVVLLGMVSDLEVVGAAANGEEALRVVEETHPDALLLDLHMPVLDGVETTRRMAATHPEVAVVILTTYDDTPSVVAALQAGARSYLTKDADRADIAQTLRGAVLGLSVLGPAVRAALLDAATGGPRGLPAAADLPDGLTRREAEILKLIAQGQNNADIADALYLSPHTVKSHINRIFSKTGSADRPAAIRYAREHGLV